MDGIGKLLNRVMSKLNIAWAYAMKKAYGLTGTMRKQLKSFEKPYKSLRRRLVSKYDMKRLPAVKAVSFLGISLMKRLNGIGKPLSKGMPKRNLDWAYTIKKV